jgi:hypothetical protein
LILTRIGNTGISDEIGLDTAADLVTVAQEVIEKFIADEGALL